MKIVITGATGNVGTSLLQALADEPQIVQIVGIARRVPERELPRVQLLSERLRGHDTGLSGSE